MSRFPCFSVVVEWENARLAGAKRATRTLRELASQVRELSEEIDGRPELIILFEKDVVARELIEDVVGVALGAEAHFEISIHSTEGSDYYSQKNRGAELASREYLLFLDSDVVPEKGWLRSLLGSVGPGVHVVAGSTYVELDSFFGRAFGLCWFFPIRPTAHGLKEVAFFYANNVLFRRDLFLAYKFPDLPLYRGQCQALAASLRQNGIRLYLQTDARVAHPPPNPRHFVHRALSDGHDKVTRARLAGQESDVGRAELRRQLALSRERVMSRIDQVEIGRGEVAAALALGRIYCLLRFAGQRWTVRSPDHAQRALGIRAVPTVLPQG